MNPEFDGHEHVTGSRFPPTSKKMSTPPVVDGNVRKHSNATSAKRFSFVPASQMRPKPRGDDSVAVTNERKE